MARDKDVAGLAVTIAARILDIADGGEALVSGVVKGLVVGSGLEFEFTGDKELKGIPDSWPIYRVQN